VGRAARSSSLEAQCSRKFSGQAVQGASNISFSGVSISGNINGGLNFNTNVNDPEAIAAARAAETSVCTPALLPAPAQAQAPTPACTKTAVLGIALGVTRQPGSAMQLPAAATEAAAKAAARQASKSQKKEKAEQEELAQLRRQNYGPDSSDDEQLVQRAPDSSDDEQLDQHAPAVATPAGNPSKKPKNAASTDKGKGATGTVKKPSPLVSKPKKSKPTWNLVSMEGPTGEPDSTLTHIPLEVGLKVKALYNAPPKPVPLGCARYANRWYKAVITSVNAKAVPPVVTVKYVEDEATEENVLYTSLQAHFTKPQADGPIQQCA
jgi:hypothetical protein